jgi:hypothetical protein
LTGVADSKRWYEPGEVRSRELVTLPRCTCQSGGMFHPAHLWGPCWVRLPGGEPCPHQEPTAEAR